mgnify:CR=1 FL=1
MLRKLKFFKIYFIIISAVFIVFQVPLTSVTSQKIYDFFVDFKSVWASVYWREELAHGRFAMMGLTSWVLWEALTKVPIASMSAIFFKPFWAWGLPGLGENAAVGTVGFLGILAGFGFLGYQNVMEIDSMKYQGDGDPDFTFMPDKNE